MINTITPGIPKNPAIKAVIGLIANAKLTFMPIKLRCAITKFVKYNITTPNIPFTSIFIGHFNNLLLKIVLLFQLSHILNIAHSCFNVPHFLFCYLYILLYYITIVYTYTFCFSNLITDNHNAFLLHFLNK